MISQTEEASAVGWGAGTVHTFVDHSTFVDHADALNQVFCLVTFQTEAIIPAA